MTTDAVPDFPREPAQPQALDPDRDLDKLLIQQFPGKVVRKDLTKLIKEGANVPVYVLEYLLGMYCATDDESEIQNGLVTVKRILSDNYVRPDEAEKIKSKIREQGSWKVIDKVTVKLNEKRDCYEAVMGNLGVKGVEMPRSFVKQFEKLLTGGIWCIITLSYFYDEENKTSPFILSDLKPIQMPNMDMDDLFAARAKFSESEWIDALIRSIGMEPSVLSQRVKWHLLARLVPLVENNYNLCELGPRGTGKSHIYKEISPNSILVSGGKTTVANLFYNMSSRKVGLVGLWDVVAFDEVAGISFQDGDGIQIMKDYMASGSFARGRDSIEANASMVFVGNINQSVETMVKTSHLLAPFPDEMIDAAFFDRMHAYVPGWEIPKMRPEFFTNRYGMIVDYFAAFCREMRKRSFSDAINQFFRLGDNLNQRDTIAVKKTVSGLLKLLHPHGQFDKEAVRRCLVYALETRRRVKEQLKKIGGMEFYDVHFSYFEKDSSEEQFVAVPEQGGGKLIPEGQLQPGSLHSISAGDKGMMGLYRSEMQCISGGGKFVISGMGSSSSAKESAKVGFDYFKANAGRVSQGIKVGDHDYHLHTVELQSQGASDTTALTTFVSLCSAVLKKPIQSQMVVLGTMSLGGSIVPVQNLADTLQISFDAGAKRILIPMASAKDIATVPAELFAKFQISFYADPVDAVFKAVGVE